MCPEDIKTDKKKKKNCQRHVLCGDTKTDEPKILSQKTIDF